MLIGKRKWILQINQFIADTENANTEVAVTAVTRTVIQDEVDLLIGDATKAEKNLGWKPKVNFKELVEKMTDADLKLAQQEKLLK